MFLKPEEATSIALDLLPYTSLREERAILQCPQTPLTDYPKKLPKESI